MGYNLSVELGQRIRRNGKPGTVIHEPDFGGRYVHVQFDDGHKAPCHPTWGMEYL